MVGGIYGGILRVELQSWREGIGGLPHPPTQAISMGLWASMSLTYGVIGAWLYASVTPSFGGGPKRGSTDGKQCWPCLGDRLK